ncbi:MAG: nucleotidyltransferase domain-containing protein [Firmicutes bacterium]|nr:nucleotidyltransferase domain-containing protein [Bacillota bacterium]
MIDLATEYLNEIKSILKEIIPSCKVMVLGSRINGNARQYSDIDLAVISESKLDPDTIENLKDAFSESNLPIMVDILDLNNITDDFREIVESRFEVLQEGETATAKDA